MSPLLRSLLEDIRQHGAFPELLSLMAKPRLHTFRLSEAEKSETARARWIYESGQLAQHNLWLELLTGVKPSEQENL